ncbi:MAG: transglycosylase domain-containing protein [Bacteroidota bacterium]
MADDDLPPLLIRPEKRPHPLGPGVPRLGPAPERKRWWRRYWDALRDADRPWYARLGLAMVGLAGAGTVLSVAAVIGVVVYALSLRSSMPDSFELMAATRAQPTLVYAASGEKLTQFEPRFREWVPLDSIPLHFRNALIATEDRRFYEHGGVDVRRTIGAFYYTLRGDRQGGSTITQQLTRNLFPESIGGARLIDRKLKEVLASRSIEGAHTKRQILEAYVNTAPFLYNAFGVELASRTYFGIPAREMTPAQSATLVAMLKGPDRYNPIRNPARALARRNLVLELMTDQGQLSRGEAEAAQGTPLGVELHRQPGESSLAPHFTEMVRLRLQNWAETRGYDVERDGLVIRTTLDLGMQREAVAAANEMVPRVARSGGARYSRETLNIHLRRTDAYRARLAEGSTEAEALAAVRRESAVVDSVREALTRLQVGLVAMEPQTGRVRAYVGSRDYARDPFDHAGVAQRQPGSVFKAIVYAAALQRGYRPEDRILDEAPEVDMGGGRVWRPRNAGGGASGSDVTLGDALAYSKNTVAAQLGLEIGAPRLAMIARRLGVESEMDVVPSLALGTSPVTVLEMVGVYGTIANEGVRRTPILIERIESASGRIIEQRGGQGESVMTRRDARTLTAMLQEVVSRGTGARARQFGATGPLAGKTGTTQRNADGWFMLMHPRMVTGGWVGYSDQRVTFNRGSSGYGSRTALPVVATFMGRIQDRLPFGTFAPAPGYGEAVQAMNPDSLFGRVEDPAVAEFDWDAYLNSYGDDPTDPVEHEALDIERPETERPDVEPQAPPSVSRINAVDDLRDARDSEVPSEEPPRRDARTGRVGWQEVPPAPEPRPPRVQRRGSDGR